ncbi:BTAD domain-containing putative transcriptional regulator [Streptomyces sp. NPDC006365]|uniref:AfsR/SARP family transcriptional regulator n=1 Tax=Streptomyces sp. NPDC006365 TaxID=3364744 RepID=UPI0036A65ACA
MRVTMRSAGRTYDDALGQADGRESTWALCGLLGPLRIGVDDLDQSASVAPKIRTVLAMLCTHPDQVVPTSALIRELWLEQPPASALRTLQTYILSIRKLLSQLAGREPLEIAEDVLVTRAGGYRLQSSGLRLDWLDFMQLADHGRAKLQAGDGHAGILLMEEALDLWRGSAFADVPTGPVLESRRLLLEESRLDTVEALVDARIEAGLHQKVIAELASLTSEHPFHEGLHAQYMRALALNGRRARALEVFGRLRTRLVNEIGIEPGYPLQQLQLTILNSHTTKYVPLSTD